MSKQRGTFHTTADALLLSRLHWRRLVQDQGTYASPFAAVIGVEHKMCNIKNRPLHFSEQHDNAATPTMKPSECGRITTVKAFKVTNPNTGLATLYTKYAGIKDISPFTTDKCTLRLQFRSNFTQTNAIPHHITTQHQPTS